MNSKEALKLLGITSNANGQKIISAYKKRLNELNKNLEEAADKTAFDEAKHEITHLEEALNVITMGEKSGDNQATPLPKRTAIKAPSKPRNPRNTATSIQPRKPKVTQSSDPVPHRPLQPDSRERKWNDKDTTSSKKAKESQKKLFKVLAILTAVALLGVIGKYAIYEPRKAEAAFQQIKSAIQNLPDQADDAAISRLRTQFSNYSLTAKEDHIAETRDTLDQRLQEIQDFREAEAIRKENERLAFIAELQEKLAAMRRTRNWLEQQNQDAQAKLIQLETARANTSDEKRREYLTTRAEYYRDYQLWIFRYEQEHPLKASTLEARVNLNAGRLRAAEQHIETGSKASTAIEDFVPLKSRRLYGDRMVNWVSLPENKHAITWLRQDEQKLIAEITIELKERLSYLNVRPAIPQSIQDLEKLGFFAGDQDPDYVRWKDKMYPDLLIETVPEGALVIDPESFNIIGKTPFNQKDLPLSETRYLVDKLGYKQETVLLTGRLNQENQEIQLTLKEQSTPLPDQNWQLPLNAESGLTMDFVFIDKGSFVMGSPEDEKHRTYDETQKEVTFDRWFWLGRTEVTQAQWESIMGTDWRTRQEIQAPNFLNPEAPVHSISWLEAVEFCQKLTAMEQAANRLSPLQRYALPTRAQWEYACRAGSETPFHYGETLTSNQANFDGTFPYGSEVKGPDLGHPIAVASYEPNRWGLYDMHGNVWEWCQDETEIISTSGSKERQERQERQERVCKGGSWFSNGTHCRSAKVNSHPSSANENTLGFRVAIVTESPLPLLNALREQAN